MSFPKDSTSSVVEEAPAPFLNSVLKLENGSEARCGNIVDGKICGKLLFKYDRTNLKGSLTIETHCRGCKDLRRFLIIG